MMSQSIPFRQALWDRCVQQGLWDKPVQQSLWDNMWVCSQFGPPMVDRFSWVAVAHPAGGGRVGQKAIECKYYLFFGWMSLTYI